MRKVYIQIICRSRYAHLLKKESAHVSVEMLSRMNNQLLNTFAPLDFPTDHRRFHKLRTGAHYGYNLYHTY